jgi:subtilisin family serine protease
MFWLQDTHQNLAAIPDTNGQVTDPTNPAHVYVADFSSREKAGQDLDVLAPGAWIRGPFAGFPGYNHLPWWSRGISDLIVNPGNFFYVGGTSMAAPHVSAAAAIALQKDPTLQQAGIEALFESTALPIGAGSRQVWDPFATDANGNPTPKFVTVTWGADAAGEGLLQVDAVVDALP